MTDTKIYESIARLYGVAASARYARSALRTEIYESAITVRYRRFVAARGGRLAICGSR